MILPLSLRLNITYLFQLPSGIGSTCVLDNTEWNENGTYEYSETCQKVMWKDGQYIHPWILDDYHPTAPEISSNGVMDFISKCKRG